MKIITKFFGLSLVLVGLSACQPETETESQYKTETVGIPQLTEMQKYAGSYTVSLGELFEGCGADLHETTQSYDTIQYYPTRDNVAQIGIDIIGDAYPTYDIIFEGVISDKQGIANLLNTDVSNISFLVTSTELNTDKSPSVVHFTTTTNSYRLDGVPYYAYLTNISITDTGWSGSFYTYSSYDPSSNCLQRADFTGVRTQ